MQNEVNFCFKITIASVFETVSLVRQMVNCLDLHSSISSRSEFRSYNVKAMGCSYHGMAGQWGIHSRHGKCSQQMETYFNSSKFYDPAA